MNNIRTSDDLAVIVRQRRRDLGLSQAQLATQVGVSRQWVIDIEKSKPRAELGLALKLLQALGLQLQVKERSTSLSGQLSKEKVAAGEEEIQALAKAFDFL